MVHITIIIGLGIIVLNMVAPASLNLRFDQIRTYRPESDQIQASQNLHQIWNFNSAYSVFKNSNIVFNLKIFQNAHLILLKFSFRTAFNSNLSFTACINLGSDTQTKPGFKPEAQIFGKILKFGICMDFANFRLKPRLDGIYKAFLRWNLTKSGAKTGCRYPTFH